MSKLTKSQAKAVVGEYLSAGIAPSDPDTIKQYVDAHRRLKYSVPQPLCAALEIAMRESVPEGFTPRVLMYKGRLRVAVIKQGFENRFEEMLEEQED
jgi:hypothetical protein